MRARRLAALWAGGIGLALAVVVARVAVDGRAALRAGEAAEARADAEEAIRHYGDAARLYLPGAGHVTRALDRLEAIAAAAEEAGAPDIARRALEAFRAAALGTRSFYTPHAGRLPAIERRLAALLAELEDPRVDPGASRAAREAWHAARLARRPGPALPYVLLALAGLALWVGAAVGFFRAGLDPGLRLRRGPAIAAGVIFVLGFALFLTGLRLA